MEGSMFGGKDEQFDDDDDEADRIRGGRTIALVPLIRATATIRRRATTTTMLVREGRYLRAFEADGVGGGVG